jgi:hypothetical protein
VHPTSGSLRVFEHFSWLGVGSGKVELSRPAQPPVTLAVGRFARDRRLFRYNIESAAIRSRTNPMTTNNFSTSAIGWVALGTGIAVILAVLFLALMFTVSISFGAVNDVLNGIFALSSAVLARTFYAEQHAKSPGLSRIALTLAILGAIFSMIGSVLILYGFTDFLLAGLYSGVGNALIGVWLVAFCFSRQHSNTLPHRLILFGFIVGAFMALGLLGIPGMLARVDSMVSMPSYLYVALSGWVGTYVLYPIWAIWLGRTLLSK